ncbi:hypothetical protein [Pararhodonellum marinum]|uniref:hypothetical protein n=1 Tax=Pararhodonellum marinum TaxID=2755358 RepID=UPI001E58C97B|nr:hypothetical protein [Pararhodonellum marinum]
MMKNTFLILAISFLLGSCAIFTPRDEFWMGMSENRFLRQNSDARISSLEDNGKIYRIQRDERFYVLITFQDRKLVNVEEREIIPVWMQNQPNPDGTIPNNRPR